MLAVAGCGQPNGPASGPIVDASSAVNTTEVSDGITFIRTTANLNDAVGYSGNLTVGRDGCLYVTIEAKTYLAAVGAAARVSRAGVEAADVAHALGVAATFGRLASSPAVPARSAEQCQQASEVFAVGF